MRSAIFPVVIIVVAIVVIIATLLVVLFEILVVVVAVVTTIIITRKLVCESRTLDLPSECQGPTFCALALQSLSGEV